MKTKEKRKWNNKKKKNGRKRLFVWKDVLNCLENDFPFFFCCVQFVSFRHFRVLYFYYIAWTRIYYILICGGQARARMQKWVQDGVSGAVAEGRSNVIILAKCCWIMSNGVLATPPAATEIFSFASYCVTLRYWDGMTTRRTSAIGIKCFSRGKSWCSALDVAEAFRLSNISFMFVFPLHATSHEIARMCSPPMQHLPLGWSAMVRKPKRIFVIFSFYLRSLVCVDCVDLI